MIYNNKAWISNRNKYITLPIAIGSIMLCFLFAMSSASAQDSSKAFDVYYRIYPECEAGLKEHIREVIEENLNSQTGEDTSVRIKNQIRAHYLTNCVLSPSEAKIIKDKEFDDYVKNEKKGEFALTINPGSKKVRFILRDLRKNMSYPWDVHVNTIDDQKLLDRLQRVAERIQSIIIGGPYKFVFSCFTYEGVKGNISALSRRLPRTLKIRLKTKLQEEDWKQYKIDADHRNLNSNQCNEFQDEYIENYFRGYDCIFMGQIDTEDNTVNISLDYSIGGKRDSMDDVSGKDTDDLEGKIFTRILERLPKIMGK
jgi:hypothetical protein